MLHDESAVNLAILMPKSGNNLNISPNILKKNEMNVFRSKPEWQ